MVCQRPTFVWQQFCVCSLAGRQKRNIVVMVRNLRGMSMKGMNHINYAFAGVTVFFELGMMIGNDLCQFGDIVRHRAGVGRKNYAHRQSDGQPNPQLSLDLSCHGQIHSHPIVIDDYHPRSPKLLESDDSKG